MRVCRAAGISEGTCEAVWLEATNGSFVMFQPCSYDEHLLVRREPGDVREADVSALIVLETLWPAWYALALTSRCGGDPVAVFSKENEALNIRQKGASLRNSWNEEWSLPLLILQALEERRDGEEDSAGWDRVEEALDSLLTADRVKPPLIVGGAVEYCSQRINENQGRTWARATIIAFSEECTSLFLRIRLDDTLEEKDVPRLYLRSLEEPAAAAVVLALAVAENWNRVVVHLLSHPLLRDILSIVVGAPESPMAPRSESRTTAIDHAILNNNVVGCGLLLFSSESETPVVRQSHFCSDAATPLESCGIGAASTFDAS